MVGDADNDLILRSTLTRVSKDGPPGTAHGSPGDAKHRPERAKGAPHHEGQIRMPDPSEKRSPSARNPATLAKSRQVGGFP
jgi:hypothetical protein